MDFYPGDFANTFFFLTLILINTYRIFTKIAPLESAFQGLSSGTIFIKIQPTIFNGLFAAVLLGGLLVRRAMMREFFGTQFQLTPPTWFLLSRRWGIFFLCLAVANELVWRNASDADWVAFKTFVAAPASVLFMMAQLPLTLRGRITNDGHAQQ